MTASEWKKQGELMGSTITVKDWRNMYDQTANPGTVQAHIERSLAQAAAKKAVSELPKVIDPVVYSLTYNAALTKALQGFRANEEHEARKVEEIALRTQLNAMAF